MNVQPDLHMDKAAFLAWVQGREENYELADGRVVMMTGGTARHALVVGNLFELLRARLDRKRWRVMTEFGVDVGPRTIRYPDVVVVDRSGIKAQRPDHKSAGARCGSAVAIDDDNRPRRQGGRVFAASQPRCLPRSRAG